jgi:molybdenum cofactor cytidylyltransferase
MKFGQFSVDDADGLVLAHALRLPDGTLSKGHVLGQGDLARLKQAGLLGVIAARIDADDVGEDQAARMLAQAVSADHLKMSEPTTGRVNVYATVKGMFTADKVAVDRLNGIDPAITFACLADHARVGAGTMVATFKIIPLAVHRQRLDRACALLRAETPFKVTPFGRYAVSLIATQLPQLKPSVMEKTARTLARRLAACGNLLEQELRTAHDTAALAASLRQVAAPAGAVPRLIIVFGASAVIDDGDVIPQAIRDAGGHVLRVGMPVDPGNLVVLGRIGTCYVLGAPGCARSPRENGFDWILERILAGEKPDADDIGRMGVGGLLMEIQTRPMPRETPGEKMAEAKVAIVMLAAGMATRMGATGGHKLLAAFDGIALVRRSALTAGNSQASSVTVVVGHRQHEIRAVLSDLPVTMPVTVIDNPDYASGMASSLTSGFASVEASGADGVLVMLADMPALTSGDLDRLIAAFREANGAAIVRAVSKGRRGNPVILPRSMNDAVLRLEGDVGARHLIETSALPVIDVEIGNAAQIDVDTPEDIVAAGGVLEPKSSSE